jgi:hypothetical protein
LSIRRGETNDWRWCLQASRQLRTIYMWRLVQALLCEQQRGTCTQHNQILGSQLAMRLSISHRFAWNKGYERIEWKAVKVCE